MPSICRSTNIATAASSNPSPRSAPRASARGRLVSTRFDRTVSYGIRRCEFDHFLLQRSGARVRDGEPLTNLRRDGDGPAASRWIVNESIVAPLVIGAGGHFCPVARHVSDIREGPPIEPIVAAQEIEVALTPAQAAACRVDADTPELYLCDDLEGYGWCFRKGPVLNVGLGRQDTHQPLASRARLRRGADFVGTHSVRSAVALEGPRLPAARRIAAAADRRWRDADWRCGGPGLRAQRGRDPAGGGIGAAGRGCREGGSRAGPLQPRRPCAVSRAAEVTLWRRRRRRSCQFARAAKRDRRDRAGRSWRTGGSPGKCFSGAGSCGRT